MVTYGERVLDSVIIVVSLVLIVVCLAVLAVAAWWVWAYVTTDLIQPYQDPEPPTTFFGAPFTFAALRASLPV